ncbi:hypothetical protein ACKFKG_01270 [Phormidesmis sp. 146-35]
MQDVLKYVDELVFAQTGKHLDTLQVSILKGVLNGQKYTEIAKEYNCTSGHAKDEAYELWQILSKALGEDLDRSNVRAAIERVSATNSNIFGNPVQVGSINFYPSSQTTESKIEDVEPLDEEIATPIDIDDAKLGNAAQRAVKLETVPRLLQLGLSVEQIAEALDLPLAEVQQITR